MAIIVDKHAKRPLVGDMNLKSYEKNLLLGGNAVRPIHYICDCGHRFTYTEADFLLNAKDSLSNDVVCPNCGFRQHFTSALHDADGRRANGVIAGIVLGFALNVFCLIGRFIIFNARRRLWRQRV